MSIFSNGNLQSKKRKSKFKHFFLTLFVLFVVISQNAQSSETVLQDIKLVKQGDVVLIDIDFGLPLLYQKHFPQKFGEILQIQLSLNEGEDPDRRIHKEVRQANDIQAPPGLEGFLIYVTYEEGVPGGPYLTLRFSRAVNFEVRAGSSLESLTIAVTNYDSAASPEGEAAGDQRSRRRNQAVPEEKVDDMMAKASQALTFGDAEGAIDLLRKIVRMPENKHTQDAREYLGLALERSNQIPRAKFEYKKYLQLYKKGEGPDRVRQRLLALQNLGLQRKKKLRRARRDDVQEDFKWFGRWSQSYSSYFVQRERVANEDPDVLDLVASRIITSNVSLQGRLRGADSNMQTIFSANHLFDLIDRDKTDARVSYFNFDYDGFKSGLSTVVGRQRARNSGVFERFDGVIAGYRITEGIKPYFYAGKPVSFFDSDLYDKKFWGSKLDIGTSKDKFGSTLYYMHQLVDELHDREAVGSVFRFTQKTFTAFALFDYDLQFKEMIAINARLGWQLGEKFKVNTSFNRRSDLTLSKAVRQAQDVSDASIIYDFTMAEYLRLGFSEEDIRNVARAFAITQENWTVGGTYQLDKDRQFNVDFSVFSNSGYDKLPDYLGAPGSGIDSGDPAFLALETKEQLGSSGTKNQYMVQAQWISTNTFVERDLHVLGARYARFSSYQQSSLYLNSRLPPYLNWNPRPRLNLTRIHQHPSPSLSGGEATSGEVMVAIEPSLKVDYRWKRAWVFDAEIGLSYKRYSGDNPNRTSPNTRNQTLRIGYNYTF